MTSSRRAIEQEHKEQRERSKGNNDRGRWFHRGMAETRVKLAKTTGWTSEPKVGQLFVSPVFLVPDAHAFVAGRMTPVRSV